MVGTNVRTRREAAEMTQMELAERVGTNQSHISGIENGARQPSLDMILRIAGALRCTLDDLTLSTVGANQIDNAAAANGKGIGVQLAE